MTHGRRQTMPRVCRDANFPDAEIVRSEERGGHGRRAGPGGVQEQRHFGDQGKYVTVYPKILHGQDTQQTRFSVDFR